MKQVRRDRASAACSPPGDRLGTFRDQAGEIGDAPPAHEQIGRRSRAVSLALRPATHRIDPLDLPAEGDQGVVDGARSQAEMEPSGHVMRDPPSSLPVKVAI